MPNLTADEIRWNLEPAPWSDSTELLHLAADAMPTIEDDDVANLFEAICLLVIERDEQIAAMREVSSVAQAELHNLQLRGDRLQRTVIELRNLARANAGATPRGRQLEGKEREQKRSPKPTTTSTTRATTRTRQRGHAHNDPSVAEQRGY